MLLSRTEKAKLELRPGVRTLTQKQRSVLLLADGNTSLLDMRSLFDGEAEQIAVDLIRDGFLEVRGAASAAARLVAQPPAATPSPPQPPRSASDSFEGKRSLATTRMFLFDLCERMFARRDPALAESFRQALRAAKDRPSMLAASREMLAHIEQAAGAARADAISERLAMLLPPEEEVL